MDANNPIVSLAQAIAQSGSALQEAIQARRGAERVYEDKCLAAQAAYDLAMAEADAELKVFTDAETKARNTFQAQNSAWIALVSDLDDENGLQLTVIEAEDPEDIPVPGVDYAEPVIVEELPPEPAPIEEPVAEVPQPPAEEPQPAAEVPSQEEAQPAAEAPSTP